MRNLWEVIRCGLACALVVAGLNFVGCAQPSGEGEPAAGDTAAETADHDHDHGEEGHDHAAEAGSGSADGEAAPEGGSSTNGDAGADL